VQREQAVEFRAQLLVVWAPVQIQAALDLVGVRLAAVLV